MLTISKIHASTYNMKIMRLRTRLMRYNNICMRRDYFHTDDENNITYCKSKHNKKWPFKPIM